MQPFSRHAGFFASLKQVEDRLAAEQEQVPPAAAAAARQAELAPPFSDTMTTSPLFLDPGTATTAGRGGGTGESSGPALDFLTVSKDEDPMATPQGDASDDDDEDDNGEEDIASLMALLGLSPPRGGGIGDGSESGGCDCSGGDGFLAKVVGVVGPKCDKEKRRVDGWIERYCGDGGCREPARLAHLLLGKASWSWEGGGSIAFPATVKDFLDRDAPPRSTEEEQREADQ